jgi:hypothetical protein
LRSWRGFLISLRFFSRSTSKSSFRFGSQYSVQDVGARQNSPRPLRGAPQRAGGPGAVRGTARGSVAAPLASTQWARLPGRGGRTIREGHELN